jgi:NAD(P)-dependent dehydrogenase (short-subunit alcohol dehydrogenase family)
MALKADVSDPVAVRALFDGAEKAYGGVDVLVNNAGIMQLSTIAEADDAFFDRHVAINLKGVFNGMRERRGACALAGALSASPRAWLGSTSRPTASTPRPRARSRR